MSRFNVTIFGAGNVGSALAAFLAPESVFAVDVVDPSEQALETIARMDLGVRLRHLTHTEALPTLLRESHVAVAAVPERSVAPLARAAATAGTHFLDFSPLKPETRRELEPVAKRRAIFNGCGVAPGIVDNIAAQLVARSSPVSDLTIRVGSIPRFPSNRLGYGQIWDIDGLIEEYINPCEALRDGVPMLIAPLEGKENIVLDGVSYECFTTSRGIANFSAFQSAGLKNVTFKTLRYPGHLDHMQFLLDDLGLRHRRDMLRSLLLNGLPIVEEDVLVISLTARGERGARKTEASACYRFRPSPALGPFNAMTCVAAAHAATMLSFLKDTGPSLCGFIEHHAISGSDITRSAFLKSLVSSQA